MTFDVAEFDYSFDEFCRHYDDLHCGDDFGRDRRKDDSEDDASFMRSLFVVSDYMKTHYSDDRERFFKMSRFVMIMNYVSHHISDFDRNDYAVCGSDRVGALVGEHLLHAVHQLFASPDLLKKNADPTPEQVMALANTFRDESRS